VTLSLFTMENATHVCKSLKNKKGKMRYFFSNSDMKATMRKAMPANQMLPVRNQTTKAIIPAGKMNRIIFAITIIITIPIMTNRSSTRRSLIFPSEGSCKPNKSKKLTRTISLKSIFKHFQNRKPSNLDIQQPKV